VATLVENDIESLSKKKVVPGSQLAETIYYPEACARRVVA
jgi:hypothetical protein